MRLRDMLDNGQAQAGSAHCTRARAIDAIKPFEDARQIVGRNADSIVGDFDDGFGFLFVRQLKSCRLQACT